MKIAFLFHEKSSHGPKWVKYFKNNFETAVLNLKRTSFNPLTILLNINYVKNQIKKLAPDILHAHGAGINGILGAFSGFHPFIITVLGSDILIASKSFLIRPFVRFALKKAELITCDAEHMRKEIMEIGIKPEKIEIIYFGVDTKKFSPGAKDQNLQNKLQISNSPTVISLRNLYPVYDIASLIKSIPIVVKKFPSAKFIIASSGPEEENLKKLASDLNILESIRFVGIINPENVVKFLRIADIYVSTSLSDAGIASSTAEAMACGLPVVITDFGDNEKWVKDGESGFLVGLKKPEALAQKIIYLFENKDIGISMGKLGRKIIEEKNNYYKEMQKVEDLYCRLYENNKIHTKKN